MSFQHRLFQKLCYFTLNIRYYSNSSSELDGYPLGTEKSFPYSLRESSGSIAIGLFKTIYDDLKFKDFNARLLKKQNYLFDIFFS